MVKPMNSIRILSGLLLIGVLTACGGNTDANDTTTTSESSTATEVPDTPAPDTTTGTVPVVDDEDEATVDEEQPTVKITVLVPELANPFWIPAKNGYEDAAEDFNVELNLTGTDQYDAQAFIAQMQSALVSGAQGIAVTPGDPESVIPIIQEAVDAGVIVGTVILDAPTSSRQFFVGPDVEYEGEVQGQMVLDLLNERGTTGTVEVVITSCIPGASGQELRRSGFESTVTGEHAYTEEFQVEIVAYLNATGDPTQNFQTYQNLVTAHPDLDVMYPMCAIDTLSAGQIKEREGLDDVIIAGHDWLPETLDFVESGVIDWALGEAPYDNAYTAIQWLAQAIREEIPVPKGFFISESIIATPDNVDEIRSSPNAAG